jgi:hypothetical protein
LNSPVQEGVFRAVFVTFAFITVFLGIVVAGNSEKPLRDFLVIVSFGIFIGFILAGSVLWVMKSFTKP